MSLKVCDEFQSNKTASVIITVFVLFENHKQIKPLIYRNSTVAPIYRDEKNPKNGSWQAVKQGVYFDLKESDMKTYFSKNHFALMAMAILLNSLLFVLSEQLETKSKFKVIELFFAFLLFISISMILHLKNTKKILTFSPMLTLFILDISIVIYGIYLRTLMKGGLKINVDNGLTLIIGIITIVIVGKSHFTLLKNKKRH